MPAFLCTQKHYFKTLIPSIIFRVGLISTSRRCHLCVKLKDKGRSREVAERVAVNIVSFAKIGHSRFPDFELRDTHCLIPRESGGCGRRAQSQTWDTWILYQLCQPRVVILGTPFLPSEFQPSYLNF